MSGYDEYVHKIHHEPEYVMIQEIERELIEVFSKSTAEVKAYIDRIVDSHILTHWAQHYVAILPTMYCTKEQILAASSALMRTYIDAFLTGAKVQARRDAEVSPVPDTAADLTGGA